MNNKIIGITAFIALVFYFVKTNQIKCAEEEKIITDLFMSNAVFLAYENKERRVSESSYEESKRASREALKYHISLRGEKSSLLGLLSDIHVDMIFDKNDEGALIKKKIREYNKR